jgi:integrase/recombinase XerD
LQLLHVYKLTSVLVDPKINAATTGLIDRYSKLLLRLQQNHNNNSLVITEFLIAANTESNISNAYRMNIIEILYKLASSHPRIGFKSMTRTNIVQFLDSLRKSEESDPLHRWVGTYNHYLTIIVKFFRWLYYPNDSSSKRQKPAVIQNIPLLKRKEQSIYKPTDLWTPEEDLLFVKYCPSKRVRAFHMICRDTSCRPHEILHAKIRDVTFKTESNYQYAEILVNGKTGSRHIPLFNSLPYLKDYLSNEHPFPTNPNSPLICGLNRSIGRSVKTRSMSKQYENYKQKLFPKLLESPGIEPEDKSKIKDLLKKRWNLYVVGRHTSLTQKAKILKEPILRAHAGWSQQSKMHLRYEHWFGNEHSKALLEEYGVIPKDEFTDDLLLMRPKQCHNCSELNQKDSRFCARCRMILSYDAYQDMKEQQIDKDMLEDLRNEIEGLKRAIMK